MKIRQFPALTPFERALFVQAWILLPLVRTSLAAFGCRRTQAWLDAFSRRGHLRPRLCDPVTDVVPTFRSAVHAPKLVQATERMVNAAARVGLVTATCLPRALVTQMLLRRSHVNATLTLGVRRQSGRLEAHAWVETVSAQAATTDGAAGYVPLEARTQLRIS